MLEGRKTGITFTFSQTLWCIKHIKVAVTNQSLKLHIYSWRIDSLRTSTHWNDSESFLSYPLVLMLHQLDIWPLVLPECHAARWLPAAWPDEEVPDGSVRPRRPAAAPGEAGPGARGPGRPGALHRGEERWASWSPRNITFNLFCKRCEDMCVYITWSYAGKRRRIGPTTHSKTSAELT